MRRNLLTVVLGIAIVLIAWQDAFALVIDIVGNDTMASIPLSVC